METKVLSILYGVSRVGKVKQWQARAEEQDNGTAIIIVESGYVGGKIRESPKLIKKGKNIDPRAFEEHTDGELLAMLLSAVFQGELLFLDDRKGFKKNFRF